jgi:hypothetical protein
LDKNSSLSVYPNPASDAVTLRISNKALLHTMAILTDLQGKQVNRFMISSYEQQISISKLSKGIYILKLTDGTAIKLKKD